MATITKPTSFSFSDIQSGYEFAQGMSEMPYTLGTSVQDYGGRRRIISVTTPPLQGNDRSDWVTFIRNLRGSANTFNLDLASYFPGETATSVPFRMAGSPQWSVVLPDFIQLSFSAMEVV